MGFDKLTGLNKAAALLLCLGEEATAKIFQELNDEEIHKVTRTMAEIEHIPSDIRVRVFEDFQISQEKFAGLFVRGHDFAKRAIAGAGGPDRVELLLDKFVSGTETRPLETIAMMQPSMVAGLLENEHPQTVALVLSTQEPKHAGAVLQHLPDDQRADVVLRIAKLEKVSPDVIKRIEDALSREIGVVGSQEQHQIGGIDKVVEILSSMEGNVDADIVENLAETDQELAEEIRKRMFTFEDLIKLDGRSLQLILREVNNDSLTLALKTASDEIKEKIFTNMSSRAADMIRDDLEAMGPVRLSEVEAMQQTIVKIAMKLEEEGKLVLGRGGGDELV